MLGFSLLIALLISNRNGGLVHGSISNEDPNSMSIVHYIGKETDLDGILLQETTEATQSITNTTPFGTNESEESDVEVNKLQGKKLNENHPPEEEIRHGSGDKSTKPKKQHQTVHDLYSKTPQNDSDVAESAENVNLPGKYAKDDAQEFSALNVNDSATEKKKKNVMGKHPKTKRKPVAHNTGAPVRSSLTFDELQQGFIDDKNFHMDFKPAYNYHYTPNKYDHGSRDKTKTIGIKFKQSEGRKIGDVTGKTPAKEENISNKLLQNLVFTNKLNENNGRQILQEMKLQKFQLTQIHSELVEISSLLRKLPSYLRVG